jgi:hypothetical protein
MVPADPVRFAAAARRLGDEARRRGLVVPGFRSPPRLAGCQRSIRLRSDGAMVVAVRVHGRALDEVVTDMVDGILAANRTAPGDMAAHRAALLGAVLGEEEASAA